MNRTDLDKHLRRAFDILAKLNPKLTVAIDQRFGVAGLTVYLAVFIALAVWLRLSERRSRS